MAPQAAAAADANVLPEFWDAVDDIDKFLCHQGELFRDALDETLETLTTCSPSYLNYGSTPSMAILGIFTQGSIPREDELPSEDPPLSDLAKDQVMCRQRVTEPAMFVPEQGLVGADFYHVNVAKDAECSDAVEQSDDEDDEGPRIYEERAILIQAFEHYESLKNEPKLSKHFENEHDTSSTYHEDVLKTPRFGEQIIVRGMTASQVAIGDIYEVAGGLSTLKIEVSSPRLCCAYVDKRNGSVYGMAGVKHYCNIAGLGGIFARVLVAGELTDSMTLVRTANPNPKWTMEYVSQTLYGEGPKSSLLKKEAYWSRDKEELRELCELEAFGRYEWRDEARYILNHWEEYHPEDEEQAASNSLSAFNMNDLFLPFLTKFRVGAYIGDNSLLKRLQQSYNYTIQQLDLLTEYFVNQV